MLKIGPKFFRPCFLMESGPKLPTQGGSQGQYPRALLCILIMSTKLFQVSRCWTTRHERYVSGNTAFSNVREKGSFCIVAQMRRAAHLWPNITMPAVWCTSQTNVLLWVWSMVRPHGMQTVRGGSSGFSEVVTKGQHHDIQLHRAGKIW